MTWYYGANHNLDQSIKTHLFIICANSSGTSYLQKVLATSHNTWNLVGEGQHTVGFSGPSEKNQCIGKLWATKPHLDTFLDDTHYDWVKIRKNWYFQAFSQTPSASVFVIKSPPLLLKVRSLVQHFNNSKFIIMVRNPYATVEGIARRRRLHRKTNTFSSDKALFKKAATQVITCFNYQRHNIECYKHNSVFITYESMCDRSTQVEKQIKSLVPELDDLVLKQHLPIKDYNEMLRNMNEQQISNLTMEELGWINSIFDKHAELLDYFGYPFMVSD